MAKRKRSSRVVEATKIDNERSSKPLAPNIPKSKTLGSTRRASKRGKLDTNPDHNGDIVDGKEALRASPDAEGQGEAFNLNNVGDIASKGNENISTKIEESDSSLSDIQTPITTPKKKLKKSPTKSSVAAKKASDEIKAYKAEVEAKKVAEKKIKKEAPDNGIERDDPDGDTSIVEDQNAEKLEAARPPPKNSNFLPLPWTGRLGYV